MFESCALREAQHEEGNGLKNIFWVIEGLDGVGKTTISFLLAEKLGAVVYRTPPKIFQKLRQKVSLKNPKFRFLFFLTSLVWTSVGVFLLKLRQPVICDRHLCTTIAYHKAIGVGVSFFLRFCCFFILKPDRCLYLWARPEILEERMESRGVVSSGDRVLCKNRDLRQKIHKSFLELEQVFGLESIDTSNMSPEELVKLILGQQG